MSGGSVALRRDHQRSAPALALLSDDRLARMAAKGSTAAFSAIYRRHHQAIYRYCLSIAGNEHDACDALQETMTSALRAIRGEEREIAVRPWLFRIAHNEAITVLRRKRRETPVDEVQVEGSTGGVEMREELRELIDDLGLLTARQRSALVMRELSGLSFEEIGGALDTSPEGAKQAVYESRCALQELREGRLLDCAEVRTKISADDRRMLRARRVRAHLRSCKGCQEFEAEIRSRRERFAAIAPLPAPAALGILHALLGGGSGGGGIAIGAGAGASLGVVAKVGIAGVIAVGVGATAIGVRDGGAETRASAEERAVAPTQSAEPAGAAQSVAVENPAQTAEKADGQGHGDTRNDGPGGSGGTRPAGNESGNSAPSATPAHTPQAEGPTDDAAVAANPSSNGNGPASTPPGHGGTPPGQGGVPPGLGEPPPGHGGTPPGQTGTPPGQGPPTSPGNSEQAPGHTGQTPAEGATPPGQTPGATPGNSGDAPGHSTGPK